jgi:hypothetical protein
VVFLPLSFILTLKIIYVKIFSEVKNMTEINIKKALNQNSQLLEEKVLKAIFKRNDIIVETLDIINPSMFAMPSYASIYSAMLSLYKSNSAINDESVQIWLESNGLSVEPNLIKKLYNETYSRLKVRETCEILRELYRRRYMLTQVRELVDKEDEQPTSSENILERINNIAIKANEQVSNNAKIASRCFEDTNSFMADITSKLKNKIEENGITTGWQTIDTALGGFYRKQLICLCASSSAGKSWIALQTCLQMCLNNPELKVLYFSLEMSKEELEQRMLSIITGIPCDVLQRPHKYFVEYDERGVLRDYYKEDPNSERVQSFLRKIKNGVDILSMIDRVNEFIKLEQFDNAYFAANKISDGKLKQQCIDKITIYKDYVFKGEHRVAGIKFWEKGLILEAKQEFVLSKDATLIDLMDASVTTDNKKLSLDILDYYLDIVGSDIAKNMTLNLLREDINTLHEQNKFIKNKFGAIRSKK